MSRTEKAAGPDGDAAVAAEYVLGTLPWAERRAAAERIANDPAFAALVGEWEERLEPLNAAFRETAPPDILPQIEARLFSARRGSRWLRLGALISGLGAPIFPGVAMATLMIAGLFWAQQSGPAPEVATLASDRHSLAIAAAYRPATEEVTLIRTAGPPPGAGQDYELWSIGASGTPVPLGLVSAAKVTRRVPGLAPGMTLAVSLEPRGGSPNGLPSLVLITGRIRRR